MISKVYRSDAVFNGAAFGVAILETALIASNPALGSNGFEIAVTLQLFISLVLDSSGGALSYRLGAIRAVKVGYLLKVLMAVCLGIAFYGAYIGNFTLLWVMIVLSSVADSVASGCLHTAFRPAYNAVNQQENGKSADYIAALSHHIPIRIGLPILILMFAAVFHIWMDTQLASILAVISIVIVRLYQLALSISDFKILKRDVTVEKQPRVHISELFKTFKVLDKGKFAQFIFADIIETIILAYLIGLIFREAEIFHHPSLNWMGSSLIALLVYTASVITSIFLANRLLMKKANNKASLIVSTMLLIIGLLIAGTNINNFLMLALYSLLGASLSSLILRMVSNDILEKLNENEAMAFNFICRLVSGILVAITMLIVIYSNQYVAITFFLLLTISTYTAYVFFTFWRINRSTIERVNADL